MNGRDAVRWPVSERPEAKAVDGALGQAVAAVVERMNLPAHWPSEAKARGALSGAFKKSIQLLSFLEHTKEYTIAVFFSISGRVLKARVFLLRADARPSSLFADSRSGGGLVSKRQRRQRALMRGGSSPCFSSPLPRLFFFLSWWRWGAGCRGTVWRVPKLKGGVEAEGGDARDERSVSP